MTVEVRSETPVEWRFAGRTLDLSRPRVMGILNVTPDSFSDGGEIQGVEAAVARAAAMVEAGADLLDVGGESTRPGAREVPVAEELQRVLPVVARLADRFDVPLSVDTRKAAVAGPALEAGARVVNDVSGLRHDPEMASLVADRGAGLVLMHMRGDPATMQERTAYADLLGEIAAELGDSLDRARAAGVDESRIVVDPGIGFAKTPEQNLELLAGLRRLRELGRPILVGPSRKSFLGHVLGVGVRDRLPGTVAACVLGYVGGARVFRVHDVAAVRQALTLAHAVASASGSAPGDGGGARP